MKVAIMQPYFFPYIGYFQLLEAVDLFVLHDRAKYVKKGWINRNRILQQGQDVVISVPLKHGSDALDIVEREIAADFDRSKLLNRITEAYRKAPQFASVYPLVERIVRHDERNLFGYLHRSIVEICRHVGIGTKIAVASSLAIDPSLRAQDKVIALCSAAGGDVYINAIGGMELYSAEAFRAAGIDLRFLRSKPIEYLQFGAPFVPWLSIIDVMMFNPAEAVRGYLESGYDLVPGG